MLIPSEVHQDDVTCTQERLFAIWKSAKAPSTFAAPRRRLPNEARVAASLGRSSFQQQPHALRPTPRSGFQARVEAAPRECGIAKRD